MKNADSIKDHLFSLNSRGIKYDLDRIRRAAELCGNPQNAYASFHIAGTNGKGSVCSYIESVVRTAGFRTGLYTSPHIIDFEERFIINGKPVTENDWLSVYNDQRAIIDKLELSFFEAATLMAFELFKRNKVEWAIFETGLGGRLDATNIIRPQVSVITGIAMDHTDYLGSTLMDVAREKLGIVKREIPLVFAKNRDHAINTLAANICSEMQSAITVCSFDDARNVRESADGTIITWNNKQYLIPLYGRHQVKNAVTALNALERAGFTDYETVRRGLQCMFIPGRFHVLEFKRKKLVFDVGHNPDAASVVVDTLKRRFADIPVVFVIGVMKDKDYSGMIAQVLPYAAHIIFTKPDIGRAAEWIDLLNAVPEVDRCRCSVGDTVRNAFITACERKESVICITGSFYTVGEAYSAAGIKPFESQ
ncbi:MAG: bifunctional folylpolyglutamate synthase/dihydrofolate synthase [Fibrobacter sp.]|nr:bifunctional folylpolyglutamate synthase/dihydrofolate synthase [Fibrobacter sp.]